MSKDIIWEIADKYQDLFNLLNQEHNLIPTISEMNEIIEESLKIAQNNNALDVGNCNMNRVN